MEPTICGTPPFANDSPGSQAVHGAPPEAGHSPHLPTRDSPNFTEGWIAVQATCTLWVMKPWRVAPSLLLQCVLVAACVPTATFMLWLSDHVTARAILQPVGPYVVPYTTHGGTVFISKTEWTEETLGWVVSFTLVAGQLLLNRSKRRVRSGAQSEPTTR